MDDPTQGGPIGALNFNTLPWANVTSYGNNGVGPWGTIGPNISSNADWIWGPNQGAGLGGPNYADNWLFIKTDVIVDGIVIPEPATLIVWSLLGGAGWLGMRVVRQGRRVGRQPWSPEARNAILEIIERGRHS